MADSKRWSADPAPRDEAQAAKTEALLALRDTLNKYAPELENNPDWERSYSAARAINIALIRAYHHPRQPDPVAKFAFLALHASLNEHIGTITASDDWRADGPAADAVGKALARAYHHAFAGSTPPEVDPEAPFSFPQAQFKSV